MRKWGSVVHGRHLVDENTRSDTTPTRCTCSRPELRFLEEEAIVRPIASGISGRTRRDVLLRPAALADLKTRFFILRQGDGRQSQSDRTGPP